MWPVAALFADSSLLSRRQGSILSSDSYPTSSSSMTTITLSVSLCPTGALDP